MWKGKRAFILGGGPSLRGLNLDALKGELTLGLNMGFLLNPTVNLVCDLRLIQKLSIDPRWEAYKGVKLWLNSEQPNDPWVPPGVTMLREATDGYRQCWSRTLSRGLFRGMSTGVSGLNLADILGADPIYLLGFDLKTYGGNTANWHTEYGREWLANDVVYRQNIAEFDAVARTHAIRSRVSNLNPHSALRCFPVEWPGAVVEGLGPAAAHPGAPPTVEPKVQIRAMEGLGDNIYTRAAVRSYVKRNGPVYLFTPWPQLFWDLPEVLVSPRETPFRTQIENLQRVDSATWHYPPLGLRELGCAYSPHGNPTALEAMTRWLGVSGDPIDFSMPVRPEWDEPWMDDLPRPLGIVHPPSVRSEWVNTSRNPKPEYIQAVIDATPEVHWVSLGWNAPGVEWYDGGNPRQIARRFDAGELRLEQMLALVSRASVALCGPCFLLPMAAALGVPVFTVFGGSYRPEFLIDPRMGPHVGHVAPSPFCACLQHDHACNKEIGRERVMEQFFRFRERQAVRT
jgi:hypothetical protein